MGKIRIKTLGDESQEKKQQEEARKRAEAKRAEKQGSEKEKIKEEVKQAETAKPQAKKSKYAEKTAKSKRSKKYNAVTAKLEKNKVYSLKEALTILPELKLAKFDESVELHMNTVDKGISGNVVLPHGNGKQTRVVVLNQSENPKAVEELVKKVEAGNIDFDVLVATPDSMPKLARVARHLGPRGLMPNPKNGTVTTKPEEVAKKYAGGQVNFKTEAKFPILHLMVGKLSFGEEKLSQNIKVAINAVQLKNIKDITLKSTMSPALKINLDSLK